MNPDAFLADLTAFSLRFAAVYGLAAVALVGLEVRNIRRALRELPEDPDARRQLTWAAHTRLSSASTGICIAAAALGLWELPHPSALRGSSLLALLVLGTCFVSNRAFALLGLWFERRVTGRDFPLVRVLLARGYLALLPWTGVFVGLALAAVCDATSIALGGKPLPIVGALCIVPGLFVVSFVARNLLMVAGREEDPEPELDADYRLGAGEDAPPLRVLRTRGSGWQMAVQLTARGGPIVLVTDELVRKWPRKETLAVLFHEAGHWARRDVTARSRVLLIGLGSALVLLLALGGATPLTAVLALGLMSSYVLPATTQAEELAADRYAVGRGATAQEMSQALIRVHEAAGLPSTWSRAGLLHTHPPLKERLDALTSGGDAASLRPVGLGWDYAWRGAGCAGNLAIAVWLESWRGTPAAIAGLVAVCSFAGAVYLFALYVMLPRIRRREAVENG